VADRSLTGVLLVGGASSRFGSAKALAELGGETLAARGWRLLGETCTERLAVGKRSDGLPLPFDVVDDGSDVRAPLAGLVAGLRAASNDRVVVLPVDVPLVRPSDLLTLGAACRDAAVPQTGPLPGAYGKSALPVLERRLERGELALRDALSQLEVEVVELDPWRLANVNTPADLDAARRRDGAVAAAVAVGRAHGFEADEPRILADWNDTIVHLAPHPLVARVGTTSFAEDHEGALAHGLRVARHAHANGGPVVPPSQSIPAGPHRAFDRALTLWELAEDRPVEPDPVELGRSLHALHVSLADYRGPAPTLEDRLARAAALASDEERMTALEPRERRFLAEAFRELQLPVLASSSPRRVLHGAPHRANVLVTHDGLRWIDFETALRGPVEWDLAYLPSEAAAAFPDADGELLGAVRPLIAAETAILCWSAFGRAPEVDTAARFHLDRLHALLDG